MCNFILKPKLQLKFEALSDICKELSQDTIRNRWLTESFSDNMCPIKPLAIILVMCSHSTADKLLNKNINTIKEDTLELSNLCKDYYVKELTKEN